MSIDTFKLSAILLIFSLLITDSAATETTIRPNIHKDLNFSAKEPNKMLFVTITAKEPNESCALRVTLYQDKMYYRNLGILQTQNNASNEYRIGFLKVGDYHLHLLHLQGQASCIVQLDFRDLPLSKHDNHAQASD